MKRVLTVDDSRAMRTIISNALADLELEILQAEHGDQAPHRQENIYLQDPSLGHRRALKLRTFKRLWFDFPGDFIAQRSDLIIRRMIVIHE